MQKYQKEQIAGQFNDWLVSNFRPKMNDKGNPLTKGDLVVFDDSVMRLVSKLLGGSFTIDVINDARKASSKSWTGLMKEMETVYRISDIDLILGLRYEEELSRHKKKGERHFDEFGTAPDGTTSIDDWIARVSDRLKRVYRIVDPTDISQPKKSMKIKGIRKSKG